MCLVPATFILVTAVHILSGSRGNISARSGWNPDYLCSPAEIALSQKIKAGIGVTGTPVIYWLGGM